MPETTPPNLDDAGLDVRTYFVRGRNALIAWAGFGGLFIDYYLHLATSGIQVTAEHDTMFKRALVAFTLHVASRPRNELVAWTINVQEPLVNLFLAGDNGTGAVTGRIFDENVRRGPDNLFYSDVVRDDQPARRSAVTFSGDDPIAGAEALYVRSEQRGARYFQLGEEDFALVSEHPDCDLEWFRGLTRGQMQTLDQSETLVLLEQRVYRWHCGCNQGRMLEVLAPVMRQDPESLFGDEPKLEVRCPRCGARHAITREALEAFVAED
jgi:molecular chaperone Hsp33